MHSRAIFGVARAALLTALALPGGGAFAGEEVTICYNYDCASQDDVNFSDTQLEQLHQMLINATDAASERAALSAVIGRMYAIAGEQTPVWRDKGGNFEDDGLNGRMDCIDHSNNTSSFMHLLARRGLLRFHEVLTPLRRRHFVLAEHWAARIKETDSTEVYIVDSWYFDNGKPAAIFTLQDWLAWRKPG